jgi:hypothetical protein
MHLLLKIIIKLNLELLPAIYQISYIDLKVMGCPHSSKLHVAEN